mgnify:CR=1 FL=1
MLSNGAARTSLNLAAACNNIVRSVCNYLYESCWKNGKTSMTPYIVDHINYCEFLLRVSANLNVIKALQWFNGSMASLSAKINNTIYRHRPYTGIDFFP